MIKNIKSIGERGAVPILILVAIIGILAYVAVSSSASFQDSLFGLLYPKSESQAASYAPGSVRFVDSSGRVIRTTSSAAVKVQYTQPNWNTGKKPPVSGPITVTTKNIVLAEDRRFRVNVKTVSVGTNGSIDYTFSNSRLGTKSLYVKFIASNNREQNARPFPVSIRLINPPVSGPILTPTPRPTPIPVCEHPAPPVGCRYEGIDVYPYCAARLVCNSPTPTPTPTPRPSLTPTPTPTSLPQSSSYKRVFKTSDSVRTYSGNLIVEANSLPGEQVQVTEGLRAADKICQYRVISRNLGGTWKAWLSSSQTSVASRLTHASVPYKRLDGVTIANNWSDLTDGSLQATINVTEFGIRTTDAGAWTNTLPNGERKYTQSTNTCDDWRTSQGCQIINGRQNCPYNGSQGVDFSTNSQWTDNSTYHCALSDSLYCFEQ